MPKIALFFRLSFSLSPSVCRSTNIQSGSMGKREKETLLLPPHNRGYRWEFLGETSYCGDISKEKPKLCKPILPISFPFILIYLSPFPSKLRDSSPL